MKQNSILPPDLGSNQIHELARKPIQEGTKEFEYSLKGFELGPILFKKLTDSDLAAFDNLSIRYFDTAIGNMLIIK